MAVTEAQEKAAESIRSIIASLAGDDAMNIVGNLVRAALMTYYEDGNLAPVIGAILDLAGICVLTVSHTGHVQVDSTSHDDAPDHVKLAMIDSNAMLTDFVDSLAGAERAH